LISGIETKRALKTKALHIGLILHFKVYSSWPKSIGQIAEDIVIGAKAERAEKFYLMVVLCTRSAH